MFLNNTLFEAGLCNGTIGIVTAITADCDTDHETDYAIHAAFPTKSRMLEVAVRRITEYFLCDGQQCSRTQYPLQTTFALTVHKTQGLTLPHISIALDHETFAPGQAYVALSRAPSWSAISILHLSRDAFKIDQQMLREYDRLHQVHENGLHRLMRND
jgi:ATP-dependent exoDNAse (exonuclease V) alpha subunit